MNSTQMNELLSLANILHVLGSAGESETCSPFAMAETAAYVEKKLLDVIESIEDEATNALLAQASSSADR